MATAMARRTHPSPALDPFVEELTRGHAAWRARQNAAMRASRVRAPRTYAAYEVICAAALLLVALALVAASHG